MKFNSIEDMDEEFYLETLLNDPSEWDEEDVEDDEPSDDDEDDGLGADGEPY